MLDLLETQKRFLHFNILVYIHNTFYYCNFSFIVFKLTEDYSKRIRNMNSKVKKHAK